MDDVHAVKRGKGLEKLYGDLLDNGDRKKAGVCLEGSQ